MPKYLITASYTDEGIKKLLTVGGTNRKNAVEKMIAEMGGKLEAFYYSFGDYDVYAISDLPDNVSAAAMSLAINASGLVSLSTSLLLTPEEVDEAAQKTVHYLPPGS